MFIKNPGKGHPRFRLMERVDGKNRTVNHEELDAINASYQQGWLTLDRARLQVEELRDKLDQSKIKPVSWLPENQIIAEQYWKERGLPRSKRRPRAAYDRIIWAVKQLGSTSLVTASVSELKQALSHLDNNGQRRAIGPLNRLLKFKNLEKELIPPEELRLEPEYLSLEDFKKVILTIPRKEWRLCCQAAFATGARYGELFQMQKQHLRQGGGFIWIAQQRLKDWSLEKTKNGKRGNVHVIKELRGPLVEWIEVSEDTKKDMRQKGLPGEAFSHAVEKVLSRHLTFHNLRHSYVKHMAERGATLEKLASWLRDSMAVVEKYYLSWVQSDAEMEDDLRRFG